MRATRAVVRLDHLQWNIDLIRSRVGPGPLLCLAVKADAYGHGIARIGRAAEEFGVDNLAVATVDEGVELREAGCSLPVLLYSLAAPEEIADVVANDITPLLSDDEQIDLYSEEAVRQNRQVTVHIKIDTGMGRIGCPPETASNLARRVVARPSLELGGVSTHFASADARDRSYTKAQIERFEGALAAIRGEQIEPGLVHAANSGGVLDHPESWYDMVRPGIIAYGYYPSDEQARSLDLRPVMELRSKVVFIKEVAPGDAISYGMTWRAPRRTYIGTIPVGYGDGYSRLLSNKGRVRINGSNYPIVGRVCMDQLMVDLGHRCPVRRYDDAIMFGYHPGAPTAEDLAQLTGTIAYEITCNISRRVPRVYTYEEP
ncbi:MAG: alanine racemase [Spirochaetota bacterium]